VKEGGSMMHGGRRTLLAMAAAVLLAVSSGAAAEDGLLETLRQAHRGRDGAAIAAAEKALVARGAGVLEAVRAASDEERQFAVKVSLEYVALAIEGKATAREVLARMRETRDPGEKMRLSFMLSKLDGPEDAAVLEAALATEADPMVAKYIVRALGSIPGPRPLEPLLRIARSSPDRNQRIEAIRSIEERASRDPAVADEATKALVALAATEADASIRSVAIRGIANVGTRAAVAFFREVLEKDERTNNRAEAAKLFQRIGTDEDLPFLEELHAKERVYYVKQKVAQAIDAIHRRAGREPPGRDPGPVVEVPLQPAPRPKSPTPPPPSFAPPPPTPPPSIAPVAPGAPARIGPAMAGPLQFPEVVAVDCPDDPAARSVFMRIRGHPASSFGTGDELGRRPGFQAYAGVRVRSIDARGVVLADASGVEIRLDVRPPAPAPTAPPSAPPPAESPR
jgi:HEAT repeat protein